MHMPDNIKDELKMLQECIEHEREAFLRRVEPYYKRISFIDSCYPQPLVASPEMVEMFLDIQNKDKENDRHN